jgi:lambda repressor-like predicted transcriptional regulator
MKALITCPAIHEPVQRMHAAGHSVRSWSEQHGLRVQTVRNLLAGQYKHRQSDVCRRIRAALVADGMMDTSL